MAITAALAKFCHYLLGHKFFSFTPPNKVWKLYWIRPCRPQNSRCGFINLLDLIFQLNTNLEKIIRLDASLGCATWHGQSHNHSFYLSCNWKFNNILTYCSLYWSTQPDCKFHSTKWLTFLERPLIYPQKESLNCQSFDRIPFVFNRWSHRHNKDIGPYFFSVSLTQYEDWYCSIYPTLCCVSTG